MSMPCYRSLLPWLLCGLYACQRDQVVVISVSNIPPQARSLQTMVTLGGKDAMEVSTFPIGAIPADTSNFSYTFGFRLPAGASGPLQVAAAALDPTGCLLTTGITTSVEPQAVHDKIPLGLSDRPPEYRVTPCLNAFPVIGRVEQLPAATGKKQRRLHVSGWGFAQGTTLGLAQDAQACPGTGAAPAQNLTRLSPLELEADEPPLLSSTGRTAACFTLQGKSGRSTSKQTDLYQVTFSRTTYALGSDVHPDAIAMADLNGDGLLDLAISAQKQGGNKTPDTGLIAVLLQQSGRTPFPATPDTQAGAAAPQSGLSDLGRFVAVPDGYVLPQSARSIAIADLDGDSRPDIVVSNTQAGTVTVLYNQGQGKFPLSGAPTFPAGDMPDFIAIADLKGDRKLGLAVINDPFSPTNISSPVSVLQSQGKGFAGPMMSPIGAGIGFLAAKDFDGDGLPDLAVTTLIITIVDSMTTVTGGVSVLLNNKGTFSMDRAQNQRNSFATAGSAGAVVAEDVNGDGKADLIVSGLAVGASTTVSDKISVLINQSTGPGTFPFAPKDDYPAGTGPFRLAVADLNGDKLPDVVVTNSATRSTGVVTLLLNQRNQAGGKDLFPRSGVLPTYEMGIDSGAIVVGDLNGDGRLDMAVANLGNIDPANPTNNTPGTITVYLNTTP